MGATPLIFFLEPMSINPGDILVGFVEKILPYGAFLSLTEGKSGLLHISEMNTCLTKNMNDLLNVGERVKVKVIEVSLEGKISLSVKALEQIPRNDKPKELEISEMFGRTGVVIEENKNFEDQLKRFVRKSRSNLADAQQQLDRKLGRKRKKKI